MNALPLAVFDTNVVVSGLLNPHGIPGRLLDLVLARRARLVYDDRVLREYFEVLTRAKFGFGEESLRVFFGIFPFQERVLAQPWCHGALPDPTDAPFLEVALAGGVPLVTGNLRHFPEACRGPAEVLSPAEWMARVFGA